MTTFKDIIEKLRVSLAEDTSVLKDFKIDDSHFKKDYVWIFDYLGRIGYDEAHYEIRPEKNQILVVLHFEGKPLKERKKFQNSIAILPNKAEWFDWWDAKSIKYNQIFDIDSPSIIDDIKSALLYLEENLGDEVRRIMKPIQKNETNMNNRIALNQILFGPPGTGKTYHTINKALEVVGFDTTGKAREKLKEEYETRVNSGQIVFTTFHQSMSYEDFIEGIKPETVDNRVIYNVKNGIFKNIAEVAKSNFENAKKENQDKLLFEDAFQKLKDEWEINTKIKFPLKTPGYDFEIYEFTETSIRFEKASGGRSHTLSINTLKELYYGKIIDFKQGVGIYYPAILEKLLKYKNDKAEKPKVENYVLIIDEINRGNVSQIFGELITLIEEDKRLGKGEALEVMLPYSKEKFGVPPNLYIIGTMNTADRSVEALDTALRRRFSFIEMPPKYDLEALKSEILGYKLQDILQIINKRIEKLLNKDNLIGHSYFLSIESPEKLQSVFQDKIIPLLQEYFFGDYGKIGLVLGNGFVEKEENKEDIFYNFEYNDGVSDFSDRPIYRIKNVLDMDESTFKIALDKLIKK